MSRLMIPVALLVALVGVNILTRNARERQSVEAVSSTTSPWLATSYALDHFTTTDLDGRPVSSALWKGQVAIVNFWATWCVPCRREIPALVAFQERYRGRVVVIGIVDDAASDDNIRKFSSALRVNYPVVRATMDLNRRFPSAEALPTTVLVDPRGRVSVAYAGELQMEELERDVLRLLTTEPGAAVPQG